MKDTVCLQLHTSAPCHADWRWIKLFSIPWISC